MQFLSNKIRFTCRKQCLQQKITAYRRARSGASLILVGVLGMLLFMFVGVATDYARLQILQSALVSSLDATALAKAKDLADDSFRTKTRPFFDQNFDNYMSARITGFNFNSNAPRDTLTLEAKAAIQPVFLGIFGLRWMEVRARSVAQVDYNNIEMALGLDNTGSMDGVNMDALKTASSVFINQIYDEEVFRDHVYTSIIPFNATVNIGTANAGWTNNAGLDWGSTSWGGCVEARDGALDTTDAPPANAPSRFNQYYWPCRSAVNPYVDNEWRTGACAGASITPLDAALGPNKECENLQPIQGLTRNRGVLLNTIREMYPIGSTHINLGLAWSWYSISPAWRGLWRGDAAANNLPGDYGNANFFKVIVLMTDGDNTIYDRNAYSGYGFVEDGKLGATDIPGAVAEMNNRLDDLCTRIKSRGIFIATLGLGAGLRNDTKDRLRRCASAPEFAFTPENAADLNATYQTVIQRLYDEVMTVRLIE